METPTPGEGTAVTVVGAGSMGHGIAQVFAMAGHDVSLVDVDEEQLSDASGNIRESLRRLGEEPDDVLDRISTTTDREAGLAGSDVMVEAVPEDVDLKKEVFAAADDVLAGHAVMATNTSTLPVTEIAGATDRPERVVGLHFSNPVPLIPVVEVVRGEQTSDATVQFAEALAEAVGKEPVLVEKDVPGFLLNRINYAFWSEALRHLDAGDLDPEAVDASVRRLGFPMGPFEVLDFAGVDVFYMACRAMGRRGVPVHISETHEELFEAGRYGMKTGAGFYEYPAPGEYSRVDIPTERRYEDNPYLMIASAVNAAAWLLANDVASREDIDTAMRGGMSWPRGPLEFADEYGIDRIVATLERLHQETGREQYEPHSLLEAMVERGELGTKAGVGFYEYEHESETFGSIAYERRDALALITLPGPDGVDDVRENWWQGLRAALERAGEDDGVRATIVRGAGESLAAGDIDEATDPDSVVEESAFVDDVVLPTYQVLRTHPRPTVVHVDGRATGVGCELVLLGDMAVAADGSRIGRPGASSEAGSRVWLSHGAASVGKKKLLELAMTDRSLTATEAADVGLVNYVVPADQAADVARELARATAARSRESIETIKEEWCRVSALDSGEFPSRDR